MVSHNLQLVKKYSDRIIEISDGKIVSDKRIKKCDYKPLENTKQNKGHHNWTSKFSLFNFKKRIKRNLFVIASLSISMIITCLVVGFINGKDIAIRNACYQQLNFGTGSISKDEVVSDTGVIKLKKSVRPDKNELRGNSVISKNFNICPNFAAVLPQIPKISHKETKLEDIEYDPIFSFCDDSIDSNLLAVGEFPNNDNLDEVIINRNCYEYLRSITKDDPLGIELNVYHKFESIYVTEYEENITDYFEYNKQVKVVGVVDELSYLNDPKIYYSYLAFESYMQEYVLLNLSTYYDNKITWYDRVMDAEDYSIISSYSYQLFLKDYRNRELLFNETLFGEYTFNSPSLIISNSLIGFLKATEYALFLFLAIGLVGTLLILAIISFTNYSEDRKTSAILSSLGARDADIENIYVNENLYSGLVALLLSFGLSIPISFLINRIVYKLINVTNIIDIPFMSFRNIPLFFPVISIVVIAGLIYISTIIPIKFSKYQQLSLELKNND